MSWAESVALFGAPCDLPAGQCQRTSHISAMMKANRRIQEMGRVIARVGDQPDGTWPRLPEEAHAVRTIAPVRAASKQGRGPPREATQTRGFGRASLLVRFPRSDVRGPNWSRAAPSRWSQGVSSANRNSPRALVGAGGGQGGEAGEGNVDEAGAAFLLVSHTLKGARRRSSRPGLCSSPWPLWRTSPGPFCRGVSRGAVAQK
jgi:hypothetical protein